VRGSGVDAGNAWGSRGNWAMWFVTDARMTAAQRTGAMGKKKTPKNRQGEKLLLGREISRF